MEESNSRNYRCLVSKNHDLFQKDTIRILSSNGFDKPNFIFEINLSDDGRKIEVYFEDLIKGEEPIFIIPANVYKDFCEFVYRLNDYIKSKVISEEVFEKEAAAVQAFHTELIKQCMLKIKKKNYGSLSQDDGNYISHSPLDRLKNMINPNKRTIVYRYEHDKSKIEKKELDRCVSYDFDISKKVNNTIYDTFLDIYIEVFLKENNSELELRLIDKDDMESYAINTAQYRLLPDFIYSLYEYWTINERSWGKDKPCKKIIKKIFITKAKEMFSSGSSKEN